MYSLVSQISIYVQLALTIINILYSLLQRAGCHLPNHVCFRFLYFFCIGAQLYSKFDTNITPDTDFYDIKIERNLLK